MLSSVTRIAIIAAFLGLLFPFIVIATAVTVAGKLSFEFARS
jgi:hypothetical protein